MMRSSSLSGSSRIGDLTCCSTPSVSSTSSNPGLIEQSSATGASRSPHMRRRNGWYDALKLVIERREWSVGWTTNIHDSDARSTRRDSQLHLKLEWRRHEIVELNWLNAVLVYEGQSTTTTVIGRRWAEVSINGKSSRATSDHSVSYSACRYTLYMRMRGHLANDPKHFHGWTLFYECWYVLLLE